MQTLSARSRLSVSLIRAYPWYAALRTFRRLVFQSAEMLSFSSTFMCANSTGHTVAVRQHVVMRGSYLQMISFYLLARFA